MPTAVGQHDLAAMNAQACNMAGACEPLQGTLVVSSFTADCARSNETAPMEPCALAFEVTITANKTQGGTVGFRVHQAQADTMNHTKCSEQHGPNPGIGFIPN